MRENAVSDVGMRVSRNNVTNVLAAVRDLILDWSLRLEKLGIKGEGMSFSTDEKSKAHTGNSVVTIGSIGDFAGNIGSQSFGQSSIKATQTTNSVDLKKSDTLHPMVGMPMPRYDLLKKNRYVNRTFVQTSRGCHQGCTFCAEPLMNGLKFRYRPVDEVIHEIENSGRAPSRLMTPTSSARRSVRRK